MWKNFASKHPANIGALVISKKKFNFLLLFNFYTSS